MNGGSILRKVFWTAFVAEVVGLVVLTNLGVGGFAVALYVIPVLIGFVGAVLGILRQPRSRLAFAVLGVNGLLLVFYFANAQIEGALRDRQEHKRMREQQEQQALDAERVRERDQFAQLIGTGKIQEAKDYLKDHAGLPLADADWLAQLFCHFTTAPPDRALLVQLRDYAKLRDGDLVGAAAKCSRRVTRLVLDLGVAPCAMTASGDKAQMTGTEPDALALLFERGCSVEARSVDGATALMHHRSPEVTRLLLQRGANPNAVDRAGRSALFYCGPEQTLPLSIALLLEAGADPNLRAADGVDRPLISQARDCGNQRVADLLVARGADPELRDRAGKSAVMYAIRDRARLAASLRWTGLHLEGRHGADLLIEAIQRDAWEQTELLLQAGANPYAPGSEGRSASARFAALQPANYADADDPRYAIRARVAQRFAESGDTGH